MIIDKIKELEQTKAKVAALEKSVAAQLDSELAALPSTYGFDSVKAFVKAVVAASGGSARAPKRRGRPAKAKAAAKPAREKKERRKRSVITDETRATVKKLAEDGKTGSEIAKTLGISVPTVQNIKKALGLVKARAAVASA